VGGASLRILLCLDAFAGSEAPVPWLERFGPMEPSAVCIVPIPRPRPAALVAYPGRQVFDDLIDERSRRACEAARARLLDRWPDIQIERLDGDAVEQLLRAAERWQAELVVLGGPAGRGGVSPALGSVARMAARYLECSALVVSRVPAAIRQIVFGMDGSPAAREALRVLARCRFDPAAHLLALGVVDAWWRDVISEDDLPPGLAAQLAVAEEREARERRAMLTRATHILAGRLSLEVETAVGSPADLLLKAAQQRAADLLVIGHQGLEPVRRLPLGSVAESLLSGATCPILIGRARGESAPRR